MPSYKVILFRSDDDTTQQQYLNIQASAISNALPDVEIEQAVASDVRFKRFSPKAPRCPALVLLKDGARVRARHAKISHDEAVAWVREVTG